MEVSLVIRRRLKELGLEQKDLAVAVEVTESYISQLLAGKKTPPAPARTDIYNKMEMCLGLPSGELARLACVQRREELKKRVLEPSRPLFKEFRELILRKCEPARLWQVRRIFEKEPFGELERLVSQKLLDVTKKVVRLELDREDWLRKMAEFSGRSYEQMRVVIIEFLETDVFNASVEHCVTFLDPLIESWDVDIETFGVEIVLNRSLIPGHVKRFEFMEREMKAPPSLEPGLEEFLQNASLSGDATAEEIEFLKSLRFKNRKPTPIYYYRELQNLRDPLHFRPA